MKIINMTQHKPTQDLIAAGVLVNSQDIQEEICKNLCFATMEEATQLMWLKVGNLVAIAQGLREATGADKVLVGGKPPYMMAHLIEVLKDNGFKPVFSFTQEVWVTDVYHDLVTKVKQETHVGFIPG